MRHFAQYIEAVPTIIDVVGKFFLYYGLPCSLHELIEDTSYALNEAKFKPEPGPEFHSSDSSGDEVDAAQFSRIMPQLSFKSRAPIITVDV